jgi:hypothetical protein
MSHVPPKWRATRFLMVFDWALMSASRRNHRQIEERLMTTTHGRPENRVVAGVGGSVSPRACPPREIAEISGW